MQQSLESQLDYAREQRERYAAKIFRNNKIAANASPVAKKMYYHWDEKMRGIQLTISKQVAHARKIQTLAKMSARGFADGDTVHHNPTGVTGRLTLDDYGYMILYATDGIEAPYNRNVALYEHSFPDMRKVD